MSFIAVTEVLVTQWLVHVSFTSVTCCIISIHGNCTISIHVSACVFHLCDLGVGDTVVTACVFHLCDLGVGDTVVTACVFHLCDLGVGDTVVTACVFHLFDQISIRTVCSCKTQPYHLWK